MHELTLSNEYNAMDKQPVDDSGDEQDDEDDDDDSQYVIPDDHGDNDKLDRSQKMIRVMRHVTHLATPNTLSSNAEKLKRGVSRDSEHQIGNATLGNFGLGTQSSRSNSINTPLMFPQNTQAKLREISKFRVTGVDSFHRDHRSSNSNIVSPTFHGRNRILAEVSPSRTNYMMGFKRMSQANYAVMKTEHMRQQSSHPSS